MPDRFVLEVPTPDDGWIDHGLYNADAFARNPDGSYVCAGHGGSPLVLRCLAQRDDVIDVLDGAGEHFTYRLIPLPSTRYRSRPE